MYRTNKGAIEPDEDDVAVEWPRPSLERHLIVAAFIADEPWTGQHRARCAQPHPSASTRARVTLGRYHLHSQTAHITFQGSHLSSTSHDLGIHHVDVFRPLPRLSNRFSRLSQFHTSMGSDLFDAPETPPKQHVDVLRPLSRLSNARYSLHSTRGRDQTQPSTRFPRLPSFVPVNVFLADKYKLVLKSPRSYARHSEHSPDSSIMGGHMTKWSLKCARAPFRNGGDRHISRHCRFF